MLTSLNLCSILEKYCYSKKITDKELDELDKAMQAKGAGEMQPLKMHREE